MVRAARHFFAFAAVTLLAISWLPAKDLADYKIGDQAEEDIFTPAPLAIIDTDATEALKAQEVKRVPAVFRFNPLAADEAAADFHESFVQTRDDFLDTIEENFDRRKLDSSTLASAKFNRLVASFQLNRLTTLLQKKNPPFPVTPELARIWAGGEPDQEFEAPLVARLRDAMKRFIRETNALPAAAKTGATVRVVPAGDNETLTAEMVARFGADHPKTDFVSFPSAKTDLQNAFPAEEHAVAKFLSSFLKPNCSLEAELTLAMRAKQVEDISAPDNYAAGQVIARRGQVIDKKIMAVIEALKKNQVADQLLQFAANASAKPAPGRNKNFWRIGLVAGAIFILIAAATLLARRQRSALLLPARVDNGALELLTSNQSDQDWQQRALAAERRAEKAQAVIRQGLIAHLARWMSDTLVQKLLFQRAHLIEAQQRAVTEVDRLGQRLETIHTRMQDRLVAYERRISELEKELDTKDEINRELIQAEIQSIRRQMDTERAKAETGAN